MEDQAPNYRSEFLTSPQHVALGLLTLGCSFAIGVTLLVFRRPHAAAPSVATSEPHALTGGTT